MGKIDSGSAVDDASLASCPTQPLPESISPTDAPLYSSTATSDQSRLPDGSPNNS